MARHERITVGTTPTLLTSAEGDPTAGSSFLIKNIGTQTIYVGDETVTTADGYPLGVGEFISADLRGRRDDLYGRVATTTNEVRVLRTGV